VSRNFLGLQTAENFLYGWFEKSGPISGKTLLVPGPKAQAA